MRRTTRQPEDKTQITALNNILMGIHYRHEFARRNLELMAASKTILETLGIPLEQAEHFISPDGKTNLAKAIIDRVKAEPAASRTELMDQVANFLGEHRVLPMTCTSGTFFPKPEDVDATLAFGIWNELMNIETFALARLRLGHPIMFPVMLINNVQLPDGTVDVSQFLKLQRYNYPMLTSLDTPKEVISDYFTVLYMAERLRQAQLGLTPDEGQVFKRIPWNEAAAALLTFDFDQQKWPHGEKKAQVQDFYRTQLRDTESKHKLKGEEPSSRAAESSYDRSLRRARLWIKNYRSII